MQGDITAIYDTNGNRMAEYVYDAWGNHTITTDIGGIGTLNPFRYRGYYFDTETGLYYLKSRYYDPQTSRFINADEVDYLGADGTLLSYNIYTYSMNNPCMYYDPNGHKATWWKPSTWNWRTISDVALNVVAGGIAIGVGVVAGYALKNIGVGIAAGFATFGGINNLANAIYYRFGSDSQSSVTPTSYHDGYINRWDRLDYTKHEIKSENYNFDAWRYYSEYNLHMHGWLWFGLTHNKDIFPFSWIAEKCYWADVSDAKDERWYVNVATVFVGLLGQ